jgi:hypothetical protein
VRLKTVASLPAAVSAGAGRFSAASNEWIGSVLALNHRFFQLLQHVVAGQRRHSSQHVLALRVRHGIIDLDRVIQFVQQVCWDDRILILAPSR